MTVWRWQALALSAVLFMTAAVIGLFSGEELVHLVSGFTEHRPVIASAHYALMGLLLTPMVLSVGVVFLVSKQATPEEMKNASARDVRRSRLYLLFVATSLVAAFLSPIPQFWAVDALALKRGYVPCPTPDWPRHQPDRWALPGPHGRTERCPGRGVDPNV